MCEKDDVRRTLEQFGNRLPLVRIGQELAARGVLGRQDAGYAIHSTTCQGTETTDVPSNRGVARGGCKGVARKSCDSSYEVCTCIRTLWLPAWTRPSSPFAAPTFPLPVGVTFPLVHPPLHPPLRRCSFRRFDSSRLHPMPSRHLPWLVAAAAQAVAVVGPIAAERGSAQASPVRRPTFEKGNVGLVETLLLNW